MAKKKPTKRQLLNELLEVDEKLAKVRMSILKSQSRKDKIEAELQDLSFNLQEICRAEQTKAGKYGYGDSIVYKKHVFSFESGNIGLKLKISPVNTVK